MNYPQVAGVAQEWQGRSPPTMPIDPDDVRWPEQEVLVELERWPGIYANRLDAELIDSLLAKQICGLKRRRTIDDNHRD